MRKHLSQNGWMYLIAALAAVGIKFHYSTAASADLLWILAPTARLVSFFTRIEFVFIEVEGFVNATGSIVIAPACAGVNFLIICFCMLVFAHLQCFRHQVKKAAWLFASGLIALVFTLPVNATRIILSINSAVLPGSYGWFTPERLHRLEGISVYFLALSLLYYASKALLTRLVGSNSEEPEFVSPSRNGFLIPFFWYLAVTLGVPLARGSFAGNFPRFVEHGLTVCLVPVLLLVSFCAIKRLAKNFLQASAFKKAITCALFLSTIVLFGAWDPDPVTATSFNIDQNGLWAESKWYTGFDGTTGEPVQSSEMDSLAALLTTNRIKYVYARAGRISGGGKVEHMPGPTFFELKKRLPEIVFLPWFSGNTDELPIQDPEWRKRVINSLGRFYGAGVTGIHLDFEPIRNNHPGYVELLEEIRDRFDGAFFVSHATCRVAPVGFIGEWVDRYFWSPDFYRATMHTADQTVLMGYNTALWSRKLYCAYMKSQTRMLLEWASEVPNHQVLIGIPSYDRGPFLFDPLVENVVSGSHGVRAALEEMPTSPKCFKGVAIYANWTTSSKEWNQFRANWLMDSSVPSVSPRHLTMAHYP